MTEDQAAIDVSAEEERYLRRAFRRFALPYLLLVMLVTLGAAIALEMAPVRSAKDSTATEVQSLVAEAASLRESIAALREELRADAEASGERLEVLEGGVSKLRASLGGPETSAELGSRLDHAHQRINALEGRLREMEASRVAAPAPGPAAQAPIWPQARPSPQLP